MYIYIYIYIYIDPLQEKVEKILLFHAFPLVVLKSNSRKAKVLADNDGFHLVWESVVLLSGNQQ